MNQVVISKLEGEHGMQGERSEWAPFMASLPARTLTPVLWPDALRGELLRGSPVLAEARQRQAALAREWGAIADAAAADPGRFSPGARAAA
jgi:hypothetical protein